MHIQPGKAHAKWPCRKLSTGGCADECLNAHWFRTLNDARRNTLANWRHEYNCERPHSIARLSGAGRVPAGYAKDVESTDGASHLCTASTAAADNQVEAKPKCARRETPVINVLRNRGQVMGIGAKFLVGTILLSAVPYLPKLGFYSDAN